MSKAEERLTLRILGFGKNYGLLHIGADQTSVNTKQIGKDSYKARRVSMKRRSKNNANKAFEEELFAEYESAFVEDYTEMFENAPVSTEV